MINVVSGAKARTSFPWAFVVFARIPNLTGFKSVAAFHFSHFWWLQSWYMYIYFLLLESPCLLVAPSQKNIGTGLPDNSMCFGNCSHRCFNRWGRRSAPVKKHMKLDNMKVDLVVGKVANMKVDKVVNIKVDNVHWTWWPTWRLT